MESSYSAGRNAGHFSRQHLLDGSLHPLKPGLARLAVSTESSHPGLDQSISICYNQPVPLGLRVQIHIGSPLQVADYCTNSVKNAKHLTGELEAALKNLRGSGN